MRIIIRLVIGLFILTLVGSVLCVVYPPFATLVMSSWDLVSPSVTQPLKAAMMPKNRGAVALVAGVVVLLGLLVALVVSSGLRTSNSIPKSK